MTTARTKGDAYVPTKTIEVSQVSMATVRRVNGRVTLFVDGEPLPPMGVCCRAYCSEEYVEGLAAGAEIRLFFIETDSGFNDPASYERTRREIRSILRHRADALFMLRCWVNPSNDWLMRHPDECVSFDRPGNVDAYPDPVRAVHGVKTRRIQSPASKKWLADLEPYVRRLVDTVNAEPFADRVIGYFPCALHGEEWFVPREGIMDLGWDWSPAFKRFYAEWLRGRYGDEETLRDAWRMPDVSLEDPWIVPVARRKLFVRAEEAEILRPGSRSSNEGDVGQFLDPAASQPEIDLYHAFMDCTIGAISTVAEMFKRIAGNDKLLGTFYSGFGTQDYKLGGTVAPYSMMTSSAPIDLLAAPFNYVDRCSGGGASFHRIPVTSLHLHGKLWFTEVECPSWKTKPALARYYHGDKWDDTFAVLNVLKRDFAAVLAADVQGWWFNNAPKTHIPGEWECTDQDCWCNDPAIFSLLRRNQDIAAEHYRRRRVSRPEAAFVYDEASNWSCDEETIIDLLWFSETFETSRCGFPVDRLFHRDLSHPETRRDYKLLVFVNCFSLDNADRAAIAAYLEESGAVALWLWGNGFINPDVHPSVDPAHMSALTGFDFQVETRARPLDFTILRNAHTITRDIHSCFRFGSFRRPVMSGGLAIGGRHIPGRAAPLDATLGNPLFAVKESDGCTILGRFLCNDGAALAITQDGKSIYHGAKILNAPLLAEIASFAGVHIWSRTDDVMVFGGGFFSIHASEASRDDPYHPDESLPDLDARKRIMLPHPSRIVDCYSGETVVADGMTLLLSMKAGETRSFFYDEY